MSLGHDFGRSEPFPVDNPIRFLYKLLIYKKKDIMKPGSRGIRDLCIHQNEEIQDKRVNR